MLGVCTNDKHHATTANKLALVANPFHAGANLHDINSLSKCPEQNSHDSRSQRSTERFHRSFVLGYSIHQDRNDTSQVQRLKPIAIVPSQIEQAAHSSAEVEPFWGKRISIVGSCGEPQYPTAEISRVISVFNRPASVPSRPAQVLIRSKCHHFSKNAQYLLEFGNSAEPRSH